MKKLIVLAMVLMMSIFALAGCNNQEAPTTTEQTPEEKKDEPKEEVKEDDKEETEAKEEEMGSEIHKVGLGVISETGKSKDAEGEKGAMAQADTTMAAVGFDKDGKVVSVTVDVAQTKVEFNAEGMPVEIKEYNDSKKERGADYNMKGASTIGKEWDEQMASLEEWMVGKTVEEIMGVEVMERDATHKHVPNVPELTSSVTITIESYQAAVQEAWENAVEVEGAAKVGLGVVTSTMKSKAAEGDKNALAQINTTISMVATDDQDKVAKVIVDVVQNKVEFDAEGKIVTDTTVETKTKKDLGDEYNMKGASAIGKEWFEQMEAFEEWMIGKSKDEIQGLKVKERDENHKAVPDVPELETSVTITVGDYQMAVSKAIDNAR